MSFVPLFGYEANPAATRQFVSTLAYPTLATAGPQLALDQSKDVFLGHALLTCNPAWKRGAQQIGSCVGWGWALAVDVLAACDVVCRGEPESYGGDSLAAATYGFSRVEARNQKVNNNGDGSYGGAAARAVTKYGTLHIGQDYNGRVFSESTGQLEKEWGRNGVPDDLEVFAAEHKVSSVTLCTTFEDAATAIQNAYPVALCSGLGFRMTFEGGLHAGYLTQSGSWAHCQMILGVRWKPEPALYICNSWGDCYSGPVDESLPKVFQRCGGWVRAATATRMLSGEDSFALAGYEGFKPRSLPDWTGGIL
jgi:hypothetical protein